MSTRTITMFLIGIVTLVGCYYDNEEELYPGSFCDTSTVALASTIMPIIQARCAIPGCHVTGGQSPNLSTPEAVVTIGGNGQLNTVAVVNRSMPPSGPLSACEQLRIKAWIDAGSPNN
jgi:hypothetical protein